jgi:hypothetical protein
VLQPGTLVKIKPDYEMSGFSGYGYVIDAYNTIQEFSDMGVTDTLEFMRYKIWVGSQQDYMTCFEYEFVVVKD